MNETEFWGLIDRVIQASENNPDVKYTALKKELKALPPDALVEFAKHFDEKDIQAYRWDLWAAAYIIQGGCSDDAFSDFRACLICAGKETYEKSLENPDYLASLDMDDPDGFLFFEGYQYLPYEVYEEMTGTEMPDTGLDFPEDPVGEEWDEDSETDLQRICPRLYEMYYE